MGLVVDRRSKDFVLLAEGRLNSCRYIGEQP